MMYDAIDVALLTSEWCAGHDQTDCPSCYARVGLESHKPRCALDLALGMRGLGTQDERNAARARIAAGEAQTMPPPANVVG